MTKQAKKNRDEITTKQKEKKTTNNNLVQQFLSIKKRNCKQF